MNNIIVNSLKKLKEKNIPNPELDLRLLLNKSSNLKKDIFLSNFDINDIDINFFKKILLERLNRKPISKIIKEKYFWKNKFFVNTDVLDPRPATENIIEEALINLKDKNRQISILDIGTGSGCLSISLAKEFMNSKITAIDISKKALNVAKKNIKIHSCDDQISLKLIDINDLDNTYDLIVSNPPYLTKNDYDKCQPEIKNFEPKIALIGGSDGLEFYRIFSKKIHTILNKKSYFICEIGHNQLEPCIDIFRNSNLILKKITKDLDNIQRTLTFFKI